MAAKCKHWPLLWTMLTLGVDEDLKDHNGHSVRSMCQINDEGKAVRPATMHVCWLPVLSHTHSLVFATRPPCSAL